MKSIRRINIDNILFFDIETAPGWLNWVDVPDHVAAEWIYKFKFRADAPPMTKQVFGMNEELPIGECANEAFANWIAALWTKEAALYPEFSRVVCVVAGYMHKGAFRVKTYSQANERELLAALSADLDAFKKANPALMLCGHYIKGFDCPFLIKRMICNRVEVPAVLDTLGLKPWELTHIDTQEIWKFGGQSATLPAIAMALGLPCPKDEMNGSDVAKAFFDGQIDKIVKYCRKDVVTTLNVFKGMRYEEPVNDLQIEYI